MIKLLYSIAIWCYGMGILVFANFNAKAKLWVQGRRHLFSRLKQVREKGEAPLIFHCASLGEYEQALPVIKKVHHNRPNLQIWVSFFSPSGFENALIPDFVVYKTYLPLDTPSNAQQFLEATQPLGIVSVKYELWPNLVLACYKHKVPFIMICATFRASQVYFKPWGGFFRRVLTKCTRVVVQNFASKNLLEAHKISSTLAGDTRFDRVSENAKKAPKYRDIEAWIGDRDVWVFGSCWEEEIEALNDFLKQCKQASLGVPKIILAPHRIDADFINRIKKILDANFKTYSTGGFEDAEILLIDQIGMLKYLYQYGRLAIIGGGYKNALHNILEACAYGVPVAFGPHHHKYPEASAAINRGAGFPIEHNQSLLNLHADKNQLLKAGTIAKEWVFEQTGSDKATADIILQEIPAKLPSEKSGR